MRQPPDSIRRKAGCLQGQPTRYASRRIAGGVCNLRAARSHPAEIRDRYGYRAFSEPFVQFRRSRWLYALCWTDSDRPSTLFDRATIWLMANKVPPPGVTTLERLIARVRSIRGHATERAG